MIPVLLLAGVATGAIACAIGVSAVDTGVSAWMGALSALSAVAALVAERAYQRGKFWGSYALDAGAAYRRRGEDEATVALRATVAATPTRDSRVRRKRGDACDTVGNRRVRK